MSNPNLLLATHALIRNANFSAFMFKNKVFNLKNFIFETEISNLFKQW
jgi:hypothetical protein